MDLIARRRFLAEEIQACANIRTAALVDAFAAVPREKFLPPGPWTVRGEGDAGGGSRQTPDADPRHVYHNISVAIDSDRQLFNGGPAAVAPAIDALQLKSGSRVLHLGCGMGYYTAVMAHVVGPDGHVLAVDVDEALATAARKNLAPFEWVTVQHGDGTEPLGRRFEAIFMHAGATHPLDTWLDTLTAGGRMVLPITAAMPQMGRISKGFMFLFTKRDEETFDARPLSLLTIYTAAAIRDESLNSAIRSALMKGFSPPVSRLRRDHHESGPTCWLHAPTFCLGA